MERPKVGLGVLIFKEDKRILLGKRRGAHGEAAWGPPGGHLEFGESFEECAIREVQEETGIAIQTPELCAVTNDIFKEEHKHYVSIFMSTVLTENQEIKNCEPHKTEEWEWFTLSNLPTPLFLPLQKLVLDKALEAILSQKKFIRNNLYSDGANYASKTSF